MCVRALGDTGGAAAAGAALLGTRHNDRSPASRQRKGELGENEREIKLVIPLFFTHIHKHTVR